MANILASSLINKIGIANAYTSEKPYVVFNVASPSNVTITIQNADNEDGYKKVISGSPSASLSSSSFRTQYGSVALNLLECLKMNTSVFYNITLATANSVKAYIDTSIKYSITVSGSGVSVGGTYSAYNVTPSPKVVVMLNASIGGENVNIPMEKFSDDRMVYFDTTAPFNRMTFFKPISVNVAAYTMYNSISNVVSVPYSSYVVLPTTLKEFDSVNYSNYYNNSNAKKYFLTTNQERYYNYGERYGLSFLSDYAVTLKKNFYTNGGVFLESQTTCDLIERNGLRTDFYDVVDLDTIEARHNKQVGYFNVIAMYNGSEMSHPIKFNVMPKCEENNEIFFLNELGGVDSFNFIDQTEVRTSISSTNTYYKNPLVTITDTRQIEGVAYKQTNKQYTATRNSIDRATVQWLEQLGKSKWVYRWTSKVNPKFEVIVLDRCDMTSNTQDAEFNVQVIYHNTNDKLPF